MRPPSLRRLSSKHTTCWIAESRQVCRPSSAAAEDATTGFQVIKRNVLPPRCQSASFCQASAAHCGPAATIKPAYVSLTSNGARRVGAHRQRFLPVRLQSPSAGHSGGEVRTDRLRSDFAQRSCRSALECSGMFLVLPPMYAVRNTTIPKLRAFDNASRKARSLVLHLHLGYPQGNGESLSLGNKKPSAAPTRQQEVRADEVR